jgi:uncharacterized protein
MSTAIPAGGSAALALNAGQAVKLVNTHGTQTVDMWCLGSRDPTQYLSVEHTRRMLGRLFPREGDPLYSNRRNVLLRMERDTSCSKHDMLLACCDRWLYAFHGCSAGHRNCRDNYFEALARLQVRPDIVPNPVNLWMNVAVDDNERITLREPVSRPGDHLVLRAVMDCYVIFSACPMDVTPVNGGGTPRPVHYQRVT